MYFMRKTRKYLLLFLLVTSPFQAYADGLVCRRFFEEDDKTQSAADHLAELSRNQLLLQQLDPRLHQRDLILNGGGGLCASTCAVNMLHALWKYSGRDTREFTQNPDGLLHRIINIAEENFKVDGRNGLRVRGLGGYYLPKSVEVLARELDPRANLQWEAKMLNEGKIDEETLESKPNELVYLGVNTGGAESHAVILLRLDTAKKELWWVDPNFPSDPKRTRYISATDAVGTTIKLSDLKDVYPDAGNRSFGNIISVYKVSVDSSGNQRSRTSSNETRKPREEVRTPKEEVGTPPNPNNFKADKLRIEGKRNLIVFKNGASEIRYVSESRSYDSINRNGTVTTVKRGFHGVVTDSLDRSYLSRVEPVQASAKDIETFKKFVRKKVRIKFVATVDQGRYGSQKYEIIRVITETNPEFLPQGGLVVKAVGSKVEESLAYDRIESISVAK